MVQPNPVYYAVEVNDVTVESGYSLYAICRKSSLPQIMSEIENPYSLFRIYHPSKKLLNLYLACGNKIR